MIAKKMGVRRESVCRYRSRRPDVVAWVYEKLGDGALLLRPLVDRRVAQLALAGSVEHMKLFYQFVVKLGTVGADAFGTPIVNQPTINLMVPLPLPPSTPAAGAPAATPAGALLPAGVPLLADIPVVAVR